MKNRNIKNFIQHFETSYYKKNRPFNLFVVYVLECMNLQFFCKQRLHNTSVCKQRESEKKRQK